MPTNEIDAAIAREEARNKRLRAELADSNASLKIMLEARRVLKGEKTPLKVKPSIPDVVEDLLRENKSPMHMDAIMQGLNRKGLASAKTTVTTALTRYVAQGRRFERTAPNTFALRKELKKTKK